jgi:AraC-like DNA-binding protein
MPSLPIPVFASAVLLFLFLRLWVIRGKLSPISILLAVCAVQTGIMALAQHYHVPGLRFVQPITATLIPPAAWFAFQWTAVRPVRSTDLLHLLVPITAMASLITAPYFLDAFVPSAFVIYGCAILFQSYKGPDAQPRAFLADGNLPTRIWQIIAAALIASALSDVLIVAAISTGFEHLQPWIISLFSVGNLLLIGIIGLSNHLQSEDTEEEGPIRVMSVADQHIWQRIQIYMLDQRPYLDPNLTLSRLSRKLCVPTKILSSVINQETGENVSRYVNDARIAAAQNALLDGETVTTAMLSSGFNTKSNFNREFLRIAGTSPSMWLANMMSPKTDLSGIAEKR